MTTTAAHVDHATYLTDYFWPHLFGELHGYLCIASGKRTGTRTGERLTDFRERYFAYPQAASMAADHALRESRHREVYFCAHLLTEQKRTAATAGPVLALWADFDGAQPPCDGSELSPTAWVDTSPGHQHCYWRLAEPCAPALAAQYNKRLAAATGADPSGYDLSQLLRVPGTVNHKNGRADSVGGTVAGDETTYTLAQLDALLPPLPEPPAPPAPAQPADGEQLPLPLDGYATAVWRGERPKRTATGDVDRSTSLLCIGRVLYDAGLAPRLIAGELAERDAALGWQKYTDRPDAASQYAAIVAELTRRGRRTGTTVPTAAADECRDSAAENARLRAQLAARDQTIAAQQEAVRAAYAERDAAYTARDLAQQHAKNVQTTYTSPALGPVGKTIVAAASVVYSNLEHGRNVDPDGRVTTYREDLAARTGLSAAQISTHLSSPTFAHFFERKLSRELVRDAETGELVRDADTGTPKQRTTITLRPRYATTGELYTAAAAYGAEAATRGEQRPPLRDRCPHARTVLKLVCQDCGHVLGSRPATAEEQNGILELAFSIPEADTPVLVGTQPEGQPFPIPEPASAELAARTALRQELAQPISDEADTQARIAALYDRAQAQQHTNEHASPAEPACFDPSADDLLTLAATLGYPRLELNPQLEPVRAGPQSWRAFADTQQAAALRGSRVLASAYRLLLTVRDQRRSARPRVVMGGGAW